VIRKKSGGCRPQTPSLPPALLPSFLPSFLPYLPHQKSQKKRSRKIRKTYRTNRPQMPSLNQRRSDRSNRAFGNGARRTAESESARGFLLKQFNVGAVDEGKEGECEDEEGVGCGELHVAVFGIGFGWVWCGWWVGEIWRDEGFSKRVG